MVMQNNGKEMYKKSVLHVQSCFLLIKVMLNGTIRNDDF